MTANPSQPPIVLERGLRAGDYLLSAMRELRKVNRPGRDAVVLAWKAAAQAIDMAPKVADGYVALALAIFEDGLPE